MPSAPRSDLPSTNEIARRPQPVVGLLSAGALGLIALACLATAPWTFGWWGGRADAAPPYRAADLDAHYLPPAWAAHKPDERARLEARARQRAESRLVIPETGAPGRDATAAEIRRARPLHLLGTDTLGRDLLARCLAGGALSLGVGASAAAVSVVIGVAWGVVAGFAGGRVDQAMMRIVDILFGLPSILLVVLLAVAVDAMVEERGAAGGMSATALELINVATLIVAIGGVSWLTMARVIRGQTLSLKARPFMEAARAMGASPWRQMTRHLLPNLAGPIIVYATLALPQAILQESFLSFLGIGVQAPLPSWGNLCSDGLVALNTVRPRWWLLVFPAALLAVTLLSLNFVGEALRERLDPRSATR